MLFFVIFINSNRQRIQSNEVSAIGERKDGAEAANLINIAKK